MLTFISVFHWITKFQRTFVTVENMHIDQYYSTFYLRYVYIWIRKRTLLVTSTVLSKLDDLSRSPTVKYTVK